ncbi:MAG: TonB-dependent receptor [Pseudomonadota bacterium]|uniref:TonB-dependent receptor plug domain-containing protein n=1 Tax=Alcanivorax sp. TaxID=1872427 RepID=UPI0025C214EB|nr:TonB-dependent receptor [Alcanivorax sp.]MED5239101.1 TonB-dependent receptor [Pseudomonadota bacterium]MEE3321679.1 TonB-dependent receptor [Pseudomonadota bacterium]
MQRNLVLAISLIASAPLLASNEIQTVKVSGAVSHELASELPTGTVVIDRQMIDSLPASDLTEVLDSVAGLQVSQLYGINGGGASVDLLGFGATGNQNTLLLLNGRRLSGIDLGTPDLTGIPLAAIERIEILPGAGAALYGNGATGGTINIITRQRYQNSAGIEASGGSYGLRSGQLHATGRHNNLSGALAGHSLTSDGYRDNNRTRNNSLFTDLRYQGEGLQAYFTATAEKQFMGLPGGRGVTATENQFRNDPEGTDTPDDEVEQENYWLMPGLRINLSDRTALTLEASKRRQHQEFDFVSGSYASDTVIHSYSVTPKLESQLTTGSAVHNWTLGFDLNKYDYDSRTSFGNRDLEQEQRAWYLHNLISLTPKLSLSAGARRLESNLTGEGDDKAQDGEMYEGGIRYTFTGNLSLFAGAQRSVRIANLDELTPFNPPIDPQTGHTYTLGASWSEGMQHSTLTLWRADIDNEILFDPISFTNRNLDDPTLHKGISINSRWRLDRDLTFTANASAQQARFDGGPFSGNDVPLVPEHTMSLSADWQALPWLSAQLHHRYVGDRRYDSDLANQYSKLDHYRSSDIQLTAHYRGAYLRAGVYNLEDNLVADYGVYSPASGGTTLYPLPERHYRIAIGYEL